MSIHSEQKKINTRRAVNARIQALRSVGRDDDYIAGSLLNMESLSQSVKDKVKNGRAEGRSNDVISQLFEKSSQGIDTPTTTSRDLETKGTLGKVSSFLGIEKAGRRIGSSLARLSPSHRRNLETIGQGEREVIETGGVSNREFAGSLGNVALNVATGGIGAKVAGNVVKGARSLKTASQGVKSLSSGKRALATGTGIGFASDVASGLEEGEGTTRALIPGLGTAFGAVLGGGAGRFIGRAGKVAKKKFGEVIKTISPRGGVNKQSRELLSSSRPAEPGIFKGAESFAENPELIRIANATENIVNPSKNITFNYNAVTDGIEDVAENSVKPFLSANKVPFNFEDFRVRLQQIQPSSSLKSDPSSFKNYNRIREEILGDIAGFIRSNSDSANATDMNVLWDARKVLDRKIARELGDATFGTPQYSGVKAAARDMREGFSEFIKDSLSNPGQAEEVNRFRDFLQVATSRGIRITNEGDAIKLMRQQMGIQDVPEDVAKSAFFQHQMNQMSLMYKASDNMVDKVLSQNGKNKIQLLSAKYPALKWLVGGAIGAGLFGGGVGAGGSIIGSTD